MFQKILIANRGEIAIRIAHTASDLGIATVAVAPQDDRACPHLRFADSQVSLPGSGAAAYLDIDSLVGVAVAEGCDAIHPGYGFLSERPDFAAACADRGVAFIGPAPETLAGMGDKLAARQSAQALGVPVVPARTPLENAGDLSRFVEDCDGPVMVKAAAGGGGRGMRMVSDSGQSADAFAQAVAEAETAFGNGTLFAERLLTSVRHVEVQLIGDGARVAHLWDRDCSLQRRHQKIIELAPAPGLNPDVRCAMLDAAVRLGKANSLKTLATVEFLVEPGANDQQGWYFLEVNPRLQVEHTVTEDWLGLDLVEMQLRLAAGAELDDLDLPKTASDGHAIQLRINAERITGAGVLPASGTLERFQPPGGRGIRTETHGEPGYTPHPGFDSLLAKLIVSGHLSLPRLLSKAARALAEFRIEGVDTNQTLLAALLARQDMQDWRVTTRMVDGILPEVAAQAETGTHGSEHVRSPMDANVVSVDVSVGDTVPRGGLLAVLEAMKMQHELRADHSCRITEQIVEAGEAIKRDALLLKIEPTDADGDTGTEKQQVAPDHVRPDLQRLLDRTAQTLDTQRADAVERRRKRGQRTARENLADLTGNAPFIEYGQLVHAAQRRRRDPEVLRAASPADGVITGIGAVNSDLFEADQSRAALLLYDGSVMAGTQGFLGHKKTDRILEVARTQKLPVIFYTEGGGGRPGDDDFADICVSGLDVKTFNLMTRLTADKPSIGVNSGYCFAGNAAVFGACDIRIATRASWIGLGGPAMVEAGGLGAHSPKDLGPAGMQAEIGLVDLLATDEAEATAMTRQVFGYFQGALMDWTEPDQRLLRHVVPENRKRVYDMRSAILGLVDTDSFLEVRQNFGPGMITGFCRIEGVPFGLIANNPHHLGGALDASASDKGAGFLRLCGRFGMPVISLCDTPGFMVGPESERQGGVQRACELIAAGAAVADRLFTVVLRKGYGIGAQGMAGGSFAAPAFVVSWPTGEFGAMGLEGAVQLGYRKELDEAPNAQARQALFDRLVAQFYERGEALNVASLQEIDAVIDPASTRSWIMQAWRATHH